VQNGDTDLPVLGLNTLDISRFPVQFLKS